MYNQNFQSSFSQFDISHLNPFSNKKDEMKNYIDLTTDVFDVLRNSGLLNPIIEGSQNLSSWLEPINESQTIYASDMINTPSNFWISCANEDVLSPISLPVSAYPREETRPSTEIVKKYSLLTNVQKIYFSEVSFYFNVDVILNTEVISDEELDKFFDYEQELLDIFDVPINFNYRPKNSYFPNSENNILIFDK